MGSKDKIFKENNFQVLNDYVSMSHLWEKKNLW